jgi:hypothetical protein
VTWQVIGLRQKVQREMLETGLPESLNAEFHSLSEWVQTLSSKFDNRVTVRLIDAASVEGFFKSLLRRFRRYPSFSVDGDRYTGTDFTRVDALITKSLNARASR